MTSESDVSAAIEFGRFTVLPSSRQLLADGVPVEVGGRAFDLLLALIGARGAVISKNDLIERAWPGRVIEDNNLQVQVAALRKALEDDRELIRTVAGRGYQFTGDIRFAQRAAPALLTNLAKSVTDLIGREAELAQVLEFIGQHRLVTLTGVGGIGKTRLAIDAARQAVPRFADGVWLVELGSLSNPELVPVTAAGAIGLTPPSGTMSPEQVAAALGTRRMLLVLDNCEHVIEAAARLVEVLLRSTPAVAVLATSREALRAPGEYVYRVPALEVPAEDTRDREGLLRSGAVQLFMARARDAEPQFSPDRRVSAIAAICRRLDGIPLAIELAAARTSALGVEGLAARLDDRFKLLTGGRRTALQRHQTLRATLDWSYDLLPAAERIVLRRLAVFAGGFTLDSASAVAADGQIAETDVIDYVANLVSKSLVIADAGRALMHYRLLETMRAYAREKLVESGELDTFARRHAEYHRDLFQRADAEWETQPSAEWLGNYARQIDNLRAALDWAFSSAGDAEVGVALTVAAIPLWMHLSLIEECRVRVQLALQSGAAIDARSELRLHAALGWALIYTTGPAREAGAAWTQAIELAEKLDDADYQLRALWGLWIYHLSGGDTRATLAVAKKFTGLAQARTLQPETWVGERMSGVSLHYLGEQVGARAHLERVLAHYEAPAQRSHTIRFQYDQRVSAQATLVRVLWLQGLPEQATRMAAGAVEEARPLGHPLSLALALEALCLVNLFCGDLDEAERNKAELVEHSLRHAIGRWQGWGKCFDGVLHARRGDIDAGLRLLRSGLDELRKTRFALFYIKFLGDLAEILGQAGEIARGLDAVDEALARSTRNDERWCLAELLRIKGELVLMDDAPGAVRNAEVHFGESLDWARRQGARSWELRTAISLAQLHDSQGRRAEAASLLEATVGGFVEGRASADVARAFHLLDTLRGR